MLHWEPVPGMGVAATKAAMVATKSTILKNILDVKSVSVKRTLVVRALEGRAEESPEVVGGISLTNQPLYGIS